jgi:hypothetical protein
MPMAFRLWCLVAALAGLAACGGDVERAKTDALATRLDQLEKRLAAAEQALEPVDRTRNDVASLDRRVTVVETSVRELASRPAAPPSIVTAAPGAAAGAPVAIGKPGPSSGPAAWGGPTTREIRQDRRTQLRALSEEFRSRLAKIHQESVANPGVDQQQQTQDTLQWYREQRRAILRGDTPPTQ